MEGGWCVSQSFLQVLSLNQQHLLLSVSCDHKLMYTHNIISYRLLANIIICVHKIICDQPKVYEYRLDCVPLPSTAPP